MLEGGLAVSRHRSLERQHASGAGDPHSSIWQPSWHLDRWSAAWLEYGEAYRERHVSPDVVDEATCRRELLFCLLGGHGISYELAQSASRLLAARGVFGDCDRRGDRLQRYVQDLLGRPWYLPLRTNGTGRRYRYPRRKAALVRQADDWLRETGEDLLAALREIPDEKGRRAWLCECPGVGPKTASWVLRNVGLGQQLAILDVHILRALEQVGRLKNYRLPRDYDAAEQAFLAWSAELGAPAAAFDLMIWEFSRSDR